MKSTHNFYFSQRHYEHLKERHTMFSEPHTECFFKGKIYTEMIEIGFEPVTKHFGDLKYVGRGTYHHVTTKTTIL